MDLNNKIVSIFPASKKSPMNCNMPTVENFGGITIYCFPYFKNPLIQKHTMRILSSVVPIILYYGMEVQTPMAIKHQLPRPGLDAAKF